MTRPWYREYWVWLLMIPPAFSILGGITMLTLAIRGRNELVVADYARIEEITNARFARDRVAADIDVRATLSFAQSADGIVSIDTALQAAAAAPLPDVLVLQLQHVSSGSADRRIVLERNEGLYRGVTTLAAGRYTLELTPPDETWRLAGAFTTIPERIVLLPMRETGSGG